MKIIRTKINTNRKKLVMVIIDGTIYEYVVSKKTPAKDVVDKLTDSLASSMARKKGGTPMVANTLFIKALLEERAEVHVYAE